MRWGIATCTCVTVRGDRELALGDSYMYMCSCVGILSETSYVVGELVGYNSMCACVLLDTHVAAYIHVH